ncbi:MAG: PKD domain-containing protein [Candidatus Thermoplasmatota archaeon]|nr:PKD domain-containing protein [Candidatus Thermoplasmatota archaeon]
MKNKYLIAISIFGIATILFSALTFSLYSDTLLLKENEQNNALEIMIIADSSLGTAPLNVNFRFFPNYLIEKIDYSWDFGDGLVSKEKNPSHIYSEAGVYNCKLTIFNGERITSDNVIITVLENNPPIIKIIVDQASGNRPLTVHFDMDGFDVDGEIVSCEWEIIYPPFFSSQKKITHSEKNFSETFLRSGLYEVKLTVKDDYGNVATDYLKIQVLGHKLELLIGTSLYFIGIFRTVIDLYNNFIDFLTPNQPKTFAEKIISFIR